MVSRAWSIAEVLFDLASLLGLNCIATVAVIVIHPKELSRTAGGAHLERHVLARGGQVE